MLKDKLRDAIESRDWGLACEFYEAMFGEVIEMPPGSPEYLDVETIRKNALLIIEACSGDYVKEEVEDTPTIVAEPEEPQSSETFSTGSIRPESVDLGTKFISSEEFDLPEDEMEGYSEAVEKAHKKRKKTYREEYKANLQVCPSCGREFDFNKEYPAGMLESSREPKCNKCRAIPG